VKACLLLWSKKQGQAISADLDRAAIEKQARQIMLETGNPMPTIGKQRVRDGGLVNSMTIRSPSAS
jgi:hypothetical protein